MVQGVGQDVEIVDVSMRYEGSDRFAVTDINVHIETGEFFSFLGPSAAVKPQFLRSDIGIFEPQTREVRISGKNMRNQHGPNKRPLP
jgi:spermidine/putrescine transport system ATP-binding protein